MTGPASGASVRDQRGSTSVLGLAVAGALVALCLVLAVVVAAVDVRHRAGAAADLAALAGAQAWVHGGQACTTADRVAAANGGRLTRCALTGTAVWVAVVVGRDAPGPWRLRAEREAWAGPVRPARPAED